MLRGYRFGLIPTEDEASRLKAQAFVDALSDVLRLPVMIHHAAGYRALVTAFQQELVHVAWLPPLSAARAVRDGTVVPIATASRGGSTSYMTGLFTRKHGPIRKVEDLRAAKVAWVDRESAGGYLVIRAALSKRGVSLVDAFREELFVRNHADVARAVHTGRVDVGATCFNVGGGPPRLGRTGYGGDAGLPLDQLEVLAQAGPIPSDIFAAHAALPETAIRALRMMLTEARPAGAYERARTLMHADAFATVTPHHLRMLDDLFEEVLAPRALTLPPSRGSLRPKG